MTNQPTLSILMPVYNEQRTIETIVQRVFAVDFGFPIEIVCVNDASSDRSLEILERLALEHPEIRVISHSTNRGKGAAIRTAIEAATGEIAIVQDSDLEYQPSDIPRVISPIVQGLADAVYGSRFASSPERRVLYYWHSVGNKLLTMLSNAVNDLNLTDMETCYKAVRLDLLKRLPLSADRFGIEPEITTRLAQFGARIYEVPISYHGRTYDEGKHIGWRDGVEALWLILRFRFFDKSMRGVSERSAAPPARRPFARWVVESMSPRLTGAVAQVGAVDSVYSRLLLTSETLCLIEEHERTRERLAQMFASSPHVKIAPIEDLSVRPDAFDEVFMFDLHPDQMVALLVDSRTALDDGGTLHLLVPAAISVDESSHTPVGMSEDSILSALNSTGFEVESIEQFDRLGALVRRALDRVGSRSADRTAGLIGRLVPLARVWGVHSRTPGRYYIVKAKPR